MAKPKQPQQPSAVFIQTVTDPAERKQRLDRLFKILQKGKEGADSPKEN